jgi:hypothetical protein
LTTDIPEDFNVAAQPTVEVPAGATEILFTPNDSFWVDNTDPNSDYGAEIEVAKIDDDFEADLIDRTKWADLELVRRVENGVFKSELTRFGSNGTNNFNFADTAAVNAYQADVTVTAVNNTEATVRARLIGRFYNTGAAGGGETGEVQASMEIRDSGSGLKVTYSVFVCGDANCDTGPTLINNNTTFGLVDLGETHTLSIAWDEKRFFTFGFDGNTVKFDASAAPVGGPSKGTFKGIGTRVQGVDGPNEGAHIEATFDNVKLINLTPSLAGVMLLLLDE